jgi:hypothetical protein
LRNRGKGEKEAAWRGREEKVKKGGRGGGGKERIGKNRREIRGGSGVKGGKGLGRRKSKKEGEAKVRREGKKRKKRKMQKRRGEDVPLNHADKLH